MDSILETVKAYLGIHSDETAFDNQIVTHINSTFLILNQFGVGPKDPYKITGSTETWSDLLGDVPDNGIQDYVSMRVRMLFDPPTNSYVMDALKTQIDEYEWRILYDADNRNREEVVNE